MKLKIVDLIPYQNDLDERIFELHETDRPSTMQSRVLALLAEVEIGRASWWVRV